jgi:hypothetical protein
MTTRLPTALGAILLLTAVASAVEPVPPPAPAPPLPQSFGPPAHLYRPLPPVRSSSPAALAPLTQGFYGMVYAIGLGGDGWDQLALVPPFDVATGVAVDESAVHPSPPAPPPSAAEDTLFDEPSSTRPW